MDIVIQLGGVECSGVERNGMYFGVSGDDRKDGSDSIVGGISLNDELSVGDPMGKDGSGGERFLQSFKGLSTVLRKVPRNAFTGEACKRNNDGGVMMNETTIEVCKTEEGLDVLDRARFGPVANDFNLVDIHLETFRRKNISEVFDGILVPLALCRICKELVQAETSENLADMFAMVGKVIGVNEDVVHVDDNTDIE
jgi:hypothetical protein